jgi:multidrug transporter EmrE-like cation transporter
VKLSDSGKPPHQGAGLAESRPVTANEKGTQNIGVMSYTYVFGTVFFTVYGQIIIKWKMNEVGALPETIGAKTAVLVSMFLDPWILSACASAFLASLCWMAALSKFDLSYAYPFMSLSFILVFLFSAFVFHEPITVWKITGLVLIVSGIVIGAR